MWTLPLKVFRCRLPLVESPPPSVASTDRRLLVRSVNGTSEVSRPLNELKLTLPRAVSGIRRSMLPLKVSMSMT